MKKKKPLVYISIMFRILFQLSKQTLTIVNAFIRDQNKQLLQAVNVSDPFP